MSRCAAICVLLLTLLAERDDGAAHGGLVLAAATELLGDWFEGRNLRFARAGDAASCFDMMRPLYLWGVGGRLC